MCLTEGGEGLGPGEASEGGEHAPIWVMRMCVLSRYGAATADSFCIRWLPVSAT